MKKGFIDLVKREGAVSPVLYGKYMYKYFTDGKRETVWRQHVWNRFTINKVYEHNFETGYKWEAIR